MALDPISVALEIGGKVIDRLWPDPAQRDAAKLELLKMQQTGELAALAAQTELAKGQQAINEEEAKSTNWYIAGARPFILWTCGIALAYSSIFEPLARFVATVCFKYIGAFPVIDTSLTLQILLGMLGLSGMRTIEKSKNVEKNR